MEEQYIHVKNTKLFEETKKAKCKDRQPSDSCALQLLIVTIVFKLNV